MLSSVAGYDSLQSKAQCIELHHTHDSNTECHSVFFAVELCDCRHDRLSGLFSFSCFLVAVRCVESGVQWGAKGLSAAWRPGIAKWWMGTLRRGQAAARAQWEGVGGGGLTHVFKWQEAVLKYARHIQKNNSCKQKAFGSSRRRESDERTCTWLTTGSNLRFHVLVRDWPHTG